MDAKNARRREQRVRRRGGTLHVVDEGPLDAPPLVLVHGYPDDHRVWDGIAALLRSRWRVIRYDVRGAGRSFAPRIVARYRIRSLVDDLVAVLDATCGTTQAHLVGHDWGGIQSWDAIADPHIAQRFASFTTISGPCLDHIALAIRSRARTSEERRERLMQVAKSWYVYLFHLPRLPSTVWKSGLGHAWSTIVQTFESGAYRDTSTPDERARNGARGVSLYRANILPRFFSPTPLRPRVPVQFIHPRRDFFVGPPYVDASLPWVDPLWRRDVDGTHWLPAIDPTSVAAWIEEFAHAAQSGSIDTFRPDLRVERDGDI